MKSIIKHIWRKVTGVLKFKSEMKGKTPQSHLWLTPDSPLSKEYIFQKQLLTGGFSKVGVFKHKPSGQLVVIKQLHNTNSAFIGFTKEEVMCHLDRMLEEEYTNGKNLNHPYIVKTIGVERENRCIILEYCKGTDFLEALDTQNINWAILARCFRQLLSAVKFLHDQSIAHLDIKLENIIYDGSCGSIKLIDFGQSKHTGDDDETPTLFGQRGTLEYMAPEVVDEKKLYYGKKADMWSCGIVLYNFMFNRMPWNVASRDDTRFKAFSVYMAKNQLQPQLFNAGELFRKYNLEPKTVLDLMGICYGLLQINPHTRLDVDGALEAVGKMLQSKSN